MDAATKIYQDIIAAGEAGLQKMIDNQQVEHQLLDFKEVTGQTAPISDPDKKNLSKSLGGFANTDGGVIVWGVACAPVDGIDAASELKPIAKIDQFKTELDTLTPQYMQPYVTGVEHHKIESVTKGSGYIVTIVPSWDGTPVRSVFKGGADFMIRAGNQFVQMPYSILADKFGKRPQPKLKVYGTSKRNMNDQMATVQLSVVNYGRGIARNISVVLGSKFPFNRSHGWQYAQGFGDATNPFDLQGVCLESRPT
ncbi:MAG: ATP-binding protein [Candidatus Obscuribacter sp.]|nr:ATP-binding protein [Candidatus Obscuribacter sp.]